jgi:hypothetical protein
MVRSKAVHERKKLGEILVDLGVLSPVQVEQILVALRRRRDRTKFGRMAREMGLASEEHILAAIAVQMEMFPGIHHWSLPRLMSQLRQPQPVGMPPRRR